MAPTTPNFSTLTWQESRAAITSLIKTQEQTLIEIRKDVRALTAMKNKILGVIFVASALGNFLSIIAMKSLEG